MVMSWFVVVMEMMDRFLFLSKKKYMLFWEKEKEKLCYIYVQLPTCDIIELKSDTVHNHISSLQHLI
jgi:hypothetical protein